MMTHHKDVQDKGFYDLHNWIIDKLMADSTYEEASADETGTLDSIIADSTKYSANAEAILALVDSHQIDLVYESITDTSSKKGPERETSEALNGFMVYPNPAGQLLNISLEDEAQATLTVYGLRGRKLLEKDLPQGNLHKLDISQLSQGTFILEIIQNKEIYKTRIVILR